MNNISHIKELIENEFAMSDINLYIDKRSQFFFFIKHEKKNYMVLLKNEVEKELLPLLKYFNEDYPELPTMIKEGPSCILFKIPDGKLARVVEEKIDDQIAIKAQSLQKKLNDLASRFNYHWEWELNYFFITKNRLMYIDLETLEQGPQTKTLETPVYDKLSLEERVKLKIAKENKRLSNPERFTKWLD